jgi:hypothetical protein
MNSFCSRPPVFWRVFTGPGSIRCAHRAAKERLGSAGDDPSCVPPGLRPLRSDQKLRLVARGPAASRLLRARPRALRCGALRAKRNLRRVPPPCGGSLQPVFPSRGLPPALP